ncbi:MAG: MATE family efflux transporter [Deltaproteobacteria bacterium]|nr:MAG: MATE family efflux transporter [Deltaproteobacteria bacterium]
MNSSASPTRRTIFGQLVSLAWPVVGLNVLTVLALAVDTAMVGRLPDAEVSLTGLGFATQVVFLLMVAMIGVTVGTVAFVARAHGARDARRVRQVVCQSATVAAGLGVGTAVLGNLAASPLLRLLGADGADLDAGLSYLRLMLVFSAFSYLAILLAAALRGVGNTLLPFVVSVFANLLNFLLNYGFILGHWGFPALGVQGAALGTGLSQVFSVLCLWLILARGVEPALHIRLRPVRVDAGHLRDLLRIGAPAALDMVVLNAAFLSIVGMLGRIDPLAVAAHGMGLRIQSLAFVPGMSISQAIGALVGQALGADDARRARAVLRAGMGLSVVVMSALAAIIVFGAPEIVSLFDVDPTGELGAYCLTWIRLLGSCMPVVGVYIALVGLFQGSGATRLSLAINALVTLAFQIPLSFILGFPLGLGAFGVWVAFPLGFVGKALLGIYVVRQGNWARLGARV